jgi:hypothetical protein
MLKRSVIEEEAEGGRRATAEEDGARECSTGARVAGATAMCESGLWMWEWRELQQAFDSVQCARENSERQ